MKAIKVKKTKLFPLYFIIGALLIVLAVFLAPLWGSTDVPWKTWGQDLINLILCGFLVTYLVIFLSKKLTRSGRSVIRLLTIIEFAILLLVALGCVLTQFKIINIVTASQILGLSLWLRGVVGVMSGYYYGSSGERHYPLWAMVLHIVFVSIGVFFLCSSIIQDIWILWIFITVLVVAAVLCIFLGIQSRPNAKPKKSKAK